jgi:HEAT repeat protein
MREVIVCLVACGLVYGQVPRIGIIDFYGLHKVSEKRLRQALAIKEGDALPSSKAAVEERLEKVDGVVLAHLEAVCCEAGAAILFVGIEEKGAAHFYLRQSPESPLTLPEEIVDAYRGFMTAYEQFARAGHVAEDLTEGHALSAVPEVRAFQERFVGLAEANSAKLREVVHNSSDPEQRSIAAYLTGYAADRRAAVDDLQYAMQDPEDSVRYNAMRSLAAIAVYAAQNPEAEIRISPTWPIEMLNSLLWKDRIRATSLLLTLTESRDPRILDQIRERALPALIEMARWKSLVHALPAYVLLGRVSGATEQEIQDTWGNDQRESMIAKIAESGKAKK